ncbi:PhzF family phenazine biosynthesis protein [Bosea sp. PAMC 26642]|uniref:PhzF family phenazine biosynthesis protein n=1 Tax=Bosea sp. (strain PAMC 26642) TaxID=1792307 RepID=UPI0007702605|nr:PhzF family phenazine biosynthesis protein [Bosea sp. PAMC 26642]AMJ60581.1 phenazine biosynthesis protein PhzF [Bosea sp. PAMC 26642]
MKRRFVTLDVFTARANAGNPLAVVLDSEGLDTAAMQTIAREFNLSETVFVSGPTDPANRAAVRIFTPGRELPFAGHPTVGTAVLLALRDTAEGRVVEKLTLEEQVGLVSCTVAVSGERAGHASFVLPKLPEEIEQAGALALLAGALGLDKREIGFDDHEPSVFSAGVGFTLVPVASLEALGSLRLDTSLWSQVMKPADHPNAFVYCRQTSESSHQFRARMFAPAMGVAEDPATGSAVAAFAGAIMRFEQPGDGEHRFVVEQGYEMGRPSQITLDLTVGRGALLSARIGGSAVMISEGVLL